MKIALCFLTMNERECLELIFDKVVHPDNAAGFDEIYAIDGGSTDGTQAFFKSKGIPIIAQSKYGRGEGFLQAFKRIRDVDAYLFFSPDGNEDPSDLTRFRSYLEAGADVVIASRMMEGAVNEEDSQFFKFRKWVNNAFNFLANFFFRKTGPYIHDTINGYRAITKRAADILQLTSYDHTIEYQMTIRAFINELKVVEFPTVEGPRLAGQIKARSIPTGISFVKKVCTELFNKKANRRSFSADNTES